MQGSLRYKSVQNAKGRAESLSRAAAKCFVPPKHFLTPRQSDSSRPNTFSRPGKVFRPAQTLSRATRKCLVPFFQPNLARWGIFANSLRPPPVATAQRTQKNCDGLRQTGGSELLYLMRGK